MPRFMYLAGVCANIAHLAKVSPRTTSTGILARTAATSVSDSKSKSKYGGRHVVTLIPGDGVGPELAVCVKEVFRQANVPVDFEEISISGTLSHEDCLNEAVVSIERNGVGLCGTLRTPIGNVAQRSLNVQMRVSLDLFANVVHCKTLPNIPTRHKDVNIAIIRENTEGEYSGLEHESVSGVVESLKIITHEKSHRIAKFAFDYAVRHGRKKVTAIHKANIMKLSDGLFLKECGEVAKLYPNITFNSMIIDNCCMQMVSNPWQFDVMLLPNLYGNIVSNVGAGLVGGAGLVQGMNVGWDHIIFEQGARHAFSSAAQRNVANPTGILLSSAGVLKHLGLNKHASMIEDAVLKTLKDGQTVTTDVGGTATTSEYLNAIIDRLSSEDVDEK